MPPHAARGLGLNSAFSTKHRLVFTAAQSWHMGIYDPTTNRHRHLEANTDRSASVFEGNSIITEGHPSHLFIAGSARARGSNEPCLYVADIDECLGGRDKPAWALLNRGSANAASHRLALLDGVQFLPGMSIAWAEDERALILFSQHHLLVQVVRVPVAWKTEPWRVERRPIKLAPGVAGLGRAATAMIYKGAMYDQRLRVLLIAAAPESAPVQAIELFD